MERIIVVHWNKSTGPEPIIQYPPKENFPSKDLFLKIWAIHELNKENPFIELYNKEENLRYISVIQEFESEIYFLVMVYKSSKGKVEGIIRDFPDTIALISKNLIELINTNKFPRAISEAYNTIKNYTKLGFEENLLNFFNDKIKYTILRILQEGVISKVELTRILREEYGFSTINIDLLLISFIRERLIEKRNIPGISECYFLLKDLSCMRVPPNNPPILKVKIDKEIIEDYKAKLIAFYVNYDSSIEIENKALITLLMDKDVYTLLKTLRKKNLSVNNCINILNNREEIFDDLLIKNIIYEAKGKVYIFSDFRFIKFTPFYIMETISKRYKEQQISFDAFMTHFKLLNEDLTKYSSLLHYEII